MSAAVSARRAAEVAELRIAAHWAALHGQPLDERDPMVEPGGEGTPGLREYAVPGLALARETHPTSARRQAGTHNGQPLRRTHHRWKTHGGYRSRPAGPGRYLWQSPHGLCHLVDHTGTHRLTLHEAELLLTAPPGLDLYPTRHTTGVDDFRTLGA